MVRSYNDIVSKVLRGGVVASLVSIVVGIILIFIYGRADGFTISTLANVREPFAQQLRSSLLLPSNFLSGMIHLDGAYFIAVGLWILVFTPITVVVISLFEFAERKNIRYVVMSIIVLINLFVAMFVIR